VTHEPRALRKALTRALNKMYTPAGASSRRIELTEEQVSRMDFEQLKREQQRALVIAYGPPASLPSDELPPAIREVIEGAKEVNSLVNRILEAES